VSWNDAVAYCNWKSAESGLEKVYRIRGGEVSGNWDADGYRLPTEAEWEYAARSRGGSDKWAGTASEGSLSGYCSFCDKNCGFSWKKENQNDGYTGTAPVGSFRPNDLGLNDMSGNVWEWCWDKYASDYYQNSPSRNPHGPSMGSHRVNRGGSWGDSPQGCRTANRGHWSPAGGNSGVGFRLAHSSR